MSLDAARTSAYATLALLESMNNSIVLELIPHHHFLSVNGLKERRDMTVPLLLDRLGQHLGFAASFQRIEGRRIEVHCALGPVHMSCLVARRQASGMEESLHVGKLHAIDIFVRE